MRIYQRTEKLEVRPITQEEIDNFGESGILLTQSNEKAGSPRIGDFVTKDPGSDLKWLRTSEELRSQGWVLRDFKAGDKARIVSNHKSGHRYAIGKVVVLGAKEKDDSGLWETNNPTDNCRWWYVHEEEMGIIY